MWAVKCLTDLCTHPSTHPPAAGDRLEVRQYERLSPLVPARRPLACLSEVQRGDCLVAFSRREVHALRQEVEGHGRHRCCVVYGALPPDARQQQAQLFNTPRTGFNVLAASGACVPTGLCWAGQAGPCLAWQQPMSVSPTTAVPPGVPLPPTWVRPPTLPADAVGMGLNLSIRRIVFTSLRKFDGTQERLLTTAEIKQVGGLAVPWLCDQGWLAGLGDWLVDRPD